MSGAIRSAGLEGDLEALCVVELVQVLSLGGKTARVSLSCQGRSGTLWMRDGAITHAVAGPLFGELAVFAMVEWNRGRFLVEQDVLSEHRSIEADATQLLLEGLRRADEQTESMPEQAAPTRARSGGVPAEIVKLVGVCAGSMLLGAIVAAGAYTASKPRPIEPPALVAAHDTGHAASPPARKPELSAGKKPRVPVLKNP